MDTFQWCRRFMTMFLADDHVEVNRVGHCNPQDPGYDWLRFTGSERSLRGNLQECRLLVSVDAGPPVVLVRRTPEVSPRRVVHISARDLLVASLQTSGAVLSKPAGRQRSLLDNVSLVRECWRPWHPVCPSPSRRCSPIRIGRR
jgi:hypothetical protein